MTSRDASDSSAGKRRRLRALYDWVIRTPQPTPSGAGIPAAVPAGNPGSRYTILRKLGEGGMGVVYAARDEQLGRTVALKKLTSLDDDTARKRFWREARLAASVNHPHICQMYEVGADGNELFIAMELLEGESLSERLRRGPLGVPEAVPIAIAALGALAALHQHGIIHRDLKPSNIFLTPHGVKLLDFGLARALHAETALATGSDLDLTRSGTVVGTPRYIAPEQISGGEVDARCDLFAIGVVLFEMLAGRPAFEGRNAIEILHATLREQPPALGGSPAVGAVDRVIRRALAKRPSERPASADEMVAELRAATAASSAGAPALAHAMTRLVVLPFRVLRPDPDIDFLAYGLSDAIAQSLSGIDSLVVRSAAVAARFGVEAPDFKALAAEADVDHVVMGTLLRAGDQVRASAQLVEAPAGTLLASHTVQVAHGDLFRLQDDIAQRVVEALALPLGRNESRSALDRPRSARAYEFYLRGNDVGRTYDQLPVARDLYLACLEHDPDFAPAWAKVGRCYQIIGKYIEDARGNYPRAEDALRKALELRPDLSIAHKYYAQVEADLGRAPQALERLLVQAQRRHDDPEIFAGLVHACRFCGLYEESLAAHDEARRLDPNVPTSFEQTLLLVGDVQRILELAGKDDPMPGVALGLAGRHEEARQWLGRLPDEAPLAVYAVWLRWLRAWADRRSEDMVTQLAAMIEHSDVRVIEDPEALFLDGWLFCEVGELDQGLELLRQGVSGGYYPAPTLLENRHFDALRGQPAFQALIAQATQAQRNARRLFDEAGGNRLFGRK